MKPIRRLRARTGSHGQGLAEFSLVLPIFLLLVLGIIDGGRAIYAYNQVSQMTRDVSRVASVTCFQTTPRCATTPGTPIAEAMQSSQVGIQGPVTWTVQCLDSVTHAAKNLTPGTGSCSIGDLVKVSATEQVGFIYGPVKSAFGDFDVGSSTEQQIIQ